MHNRQRRLARTITLGALATLVSSLCVQAQTAPLAPQPASGEPAPPAPNHGELTLYTSAHHLTAGLGHWRELGVRGSYTAAAHVLQGEAATMRRFGESGQFIGLGDTYTFDDDWFGSLSVGAGDGASYLPRVRLDAFIHRKLLSERNLVVSLGAGHYRAPDGHSDRNASLGATYYFSEPWILQGELRLNNSRPGSVNTHQQFLALTWGRDKQTQVTARHGWGHEGYQTIGNGNVLVDLASHETHLNLRHWLGPDWGLSAEVERYSSPYYRRTGGTLGLFWELP